MGLLCGPCYSCHNDLIEIKLQNFEPDDVTKPGRWNETYDDYVSRMPPSPSRSAERYEESKGKFLEEQRRRLIKQSRHPSRAHLYHMSIDPSMVKEFDKLATWRKD
jgi:hypothetical protein